MIVTHTFLENQVKELNNWLNNHPKQHYLYFKKKQKRDHYVWKLHQMDEFGLQTIKIN